jgi:phage baseplate assembly protein W
MFTEYLNIPVDFGGLIKKAELKRIDITQSIRKMIHLILTTSYGEARFDPMFGCEIWAHDFETIYNPHSFKEDLKKSLQNTIKRNEKRLSNVTIDLQIEQLEVGSKIKNKRIKTRVALTVNGSIEKTNDVFSHKEVFFIGPLSYS